MASTRASLLRSLYRRVHPDLFHRQPAAHAVNLASMQELQSFLDAGPRSRASEPVKLRFFVAGSDAAAPAREVSLTWRPPGAVGDERWARSGDACVRALLREVDPEAAAADGAAAGAEAAAPSEPAPAAGARPLPSVRLRDDLVFCASDVPADRRAAACARLRRLLPGALPAGAASHPPILLHAAAEPPAEGARRGFACVALDFDEAALADALARARGGVAAAAGDAAAAMRLAAALERALGCERVELGRDLGAPEAAGLLRALRPDASPLRAALDAPWHGLSLVVRAAAADRDAPADAADADADDAPPPALELADAPDAGGAVVLSGAEGAAGAAGWVRREWRALRCAQERFALAAELRDRLRLGGVDAHGLGAGDGAGAGGAQVDSLRHAVRSLREQQVRLPEEAATMRMRLRIGGADGGGGGGGAGELLTLAVPSYFEIGDVLARLERASKSLPRRRRVKLYD